MAEIKTKQTDADVHEFLNSFVDNEQKLKDSLELIKLMQDVTGFEPKMWDQVLLGLAAFIINLTEVVRKAIGHWQASLHEKQLFRYTYIPGLKNMNICWKV